MSTKMVTTNNEEHDIEIISDKPWISHDVEIYINNKLYYLTGSLIADSKTNYRFLVKDFETDLYIGKEYHVILSETDTHYYLAKSVIKLDSSDNNLFIGDNKQLILEIYTDFVTVIEKPKESFIREIHFTKTEIQ